MPPYYSYGGIMIRKDSSSPKTRERARAACENIVNSNRWPTYSEVLAITGGRKSLVREAIKSFEFEASAIVAKHLFDKNNASSLTDRLDESRNTIEILSGQLAEVSKNGLAQLEGIERFLLRQASEGRELENAAGKRELHRIKALADQRFLDIKRLERQLLDYKNLLKKNGIEDPY